ncbi:MAG: type II toxin-antitoxin system HicA family toxin [Bacteroidota bacterium]
MTKLFSSNEIEKAFRKFGIVLSSQRGSHGKFKHADGRVIVLPMNKKEIPI